MAKSVWEKPVLIAFLGIVGPPPYLLAHLQVMKKEHQASKIKQPSLFFVHGKISQVLT
jgi:hypothetical protein